MQNGRFLRVNLSNSQITTEMVPEQVTADFVGGRGYGVKYLFDEMKPGIEPLSAENKLIFLNGPLAGTAAQAVSRWMVCTRSPLTRTYTRSVGGADFGAWLRFAGYDFIIVEGKAEKPVYIHLTMDSCQILDATELWGKNTQETQTLLKGKHPGNTRSVCIGPAGEKLVKYSGIFSGTRTAGRGGTGAVMGFKNLKAISVTANRTLHLFDPDTFADLARQQAAILRENKGYQNHKEWGTTRTQNITNDLGIYPVMNCRYGRLNGWEKVTGEEYRKYRTGEDGCYACSARCGKITSVKSGPYAGATSEGPEYETIWVFTGPINSTNIEVTIAADQLCDELGLDTISTGGVISMAYELYEKGILSRADTDGLELTYGNCVPLIPLINKIGTREGIGNLLAEGSAAAASQIGKGAEYYAMHVKGMDFPAYEPRGTKAMGFNYATSNIGASHCFGYARQDVFGSVEPRASDRFAEEENADLVIYNQDMMAMRETGIICSFAANWGWANPLFGKMLTAARGVNEFSDDEYLKKVGQRIMNLERAFNVREGFDRKHDTLPQRQLTEPLHTNGAPGEGQVVLHLDEFLDKYYEMRGWTSDGIPSTARLISLGLSTAVKDLE